MISPIFNPLPIFDGKYELCGELGGGAMGTVWEARHLQTSEIVAIKILHTHLFASPSVRKRFMREVESTRRLRHRNCVEVLGHGQTKDGTGYLVMERLIGTTLESVLKERGPLSQRRAINLAAQILDAVGEAHRAGIVHRDLKPSNVMLINRNGNADFVKVCDFGLAKAIEEDELDRIEQDPLAPITQPGEICGTPAYMAPEQARGESIDARADLYAVGVVLYYAIAGQLPFSGPSALAILGQLLSTPPCRPSLLRPDLGIFPPLENLVLRALAKDRAERPSSAEVFRADLLQLARDYRRLFPTGGGVSSLKVATNQAGTLPAAPRKHWAQRRHSRRAIVVSTLGFAVACLAFTGWWRNTAKYRDHAWQGAVVNAAELPVDRVSRRATERTVATNEAALPLQPIVSAVAQAQVVPKIETVHQVRPVRPGKDAPASVQSSAAVHKPMVELAPIGHAEMADLQNAESLLSRSLVGQACAQGQLAATRAPNSASVWEFLGRCYMRLGQPAKARAYYRKYLAIVPEGSNAVFIRAIVGQESQ